MEVVKNMIKETYYNRYRGWGEKPPGGSVIIDVTRSAGHILSPSRELLCDYKMKRINWSQYVTRFKKEMDNELCRGVMKVIKERAKEVDVYLVCFCYNKEKKCHRYLLMDMINNME